MAAQVNPSASAAGRPRQLLALGTGGLIDPDAGPLDEFALALTGIARPRVCLIPTASGDASAFVAAFYRAFGGRAICSHLPLFQREPGDLRAMLLAQDLLYIGGGNTANLLAVWRLHGVDAIVADAFAAGVVVVGVSAGACALFEAGVSASFGSLAPLHDGLGLIEGAFAPHWSARGDLLQKMVADGSPRGWGIGDDAGLHFVDGAFHAAIGLGADAQAFRVDPGPIAQPLAVRTL
jgi:peptidase E